MGTFAELFTDGAGTIPESRRKEFAERIEKLYQAGDVIFVPEGPEYENKGLYYWGEFGF